MSCRRRTWEILGVAKVGDRSSRIFDVAILSLIFLNIVAVIVGTVEFIQLRWGKWLNLFEIISVIVFTVEYLSRIWASTVDHRFSHPIKGRLRFALTPLAIIDLFAILPFYVPLLGVDLRSLRIFRLFRLVRLAKIGRYYTSLNVIRQVLRTKKEELVLTLVIMGLLLVVTSTLLYYCENSVQPDTFSSIPATMWWSVATLTTVGYGDMYPITVLGKLCAGAIAIIGIAMFALPTGIIGAGFVEAIRNTKRAAKTCPNCGEEIT